MVKRDFYDRRTGVAKSTFSDRGVRTDRNVIPVRISERELLGLSVWIYVWLLNPNNVEIVQLFRWAFKELDPIPQFKATAKIGGVYGREA